MTRFPVRLLTVLLLAAWIAPGGSPAAAGTKQAKPPAPPTKKAEPSPLEQRIRQLRDTRDRLSLFLSGQKSIDVPPEALFTVDLANEEAVARRVKELTGDRQGAAEAIPSPDGKSSAKPVAGEEEARRLAAEIDRLRLEFLSLPKERRDSLVAAQRTAREHTETAEALEQERSASSSFGRGSAPDRFPPSGFRPPISETCCARSGSSPPAGSPSPTPG